MPVFNVAEEETTTPGTFFYHIQDGFHYNCNRRAEGVMYLKCVLFERGCRGRAIFDQVDGFVHSQGHIHGPDLLYPDEIALRRAILERCRGLEYTPFRTILDEEWRRFDPEVVARVTYARMRTPMRNARMSRYPPAPQDLQGLTDLLMDPQHRVITMTDDGNGNIFAGSVTDANGGHHVLFVSERQIEIIKELNVIHSDGTFKTVPVSPEFADQLFCLVGVWEDTILLLGVALMESRTEVAYTAVLQLLQQIVGPDVNVTRVITDFETAEQNAWEVVYQLVVQGCLWHLGRAFLEKATDLSLVPHIRRVPEVRAIVRMCMALSLLPEEHIVEGFQIILQHAQGEGRYIFRMVRPFLRYVWQYWVSRPWRRRRMCVFGSLARTNNACESMNKTLRDLLGTHPNVYAFIRGLVTLEQRTFYARNALERGRNPNRARKLTSVINDRRIVRLSNQLIRPPGPVARAIFRFLREASHLLDNMIDEALHARRPRRA